METETVGIHKGEPAERYGVYVEEYVLSYLKREADSLELSDIYFYGRRELENRKIYVYGAGRKKGIAAFAKYELLSELACRLTQAGPVFMLYGEDGSCKATGFQIFYENNEAMQNFLIGWTGSEDKDRPEKESDRPVTQTMTQMSQTFPGPTGKKVKKHTVHEAISVQLCLVLVALVAIVITSTDSYDKMEQLGQSAKEVFFAIENQETEKSAGDSGEQTEIVVERNIEPIEPAKREEEPAEREEEPEERGKQKEPGEQEEGPKEPEGEHGEQEEEPEEGVLVPAADRAEESPEQSLAAESAGETEEDSEEEPEENPEVNSGIDSGMDSGMMEDSANSAEEQASEKAEDVREEEPQDNEEEKEAFSRSITRYYEVQRGDTLYTISQEIYGDISRVDKICELNQISNPDKIRYGQKIILP